MNFRALCGVFVRVVISVIFSGIFYTAWLAVAIPVLKSETVNPLLGNVLRVAAPVMTALGFALGVFIFERFPQARKSKFIDIFRWSFAGCAIGTVVVIFFGPMLIVFGMFALGTAAIATREILIIRKAGKTPPPKN